MKLPPAGFSKAVTHDGRDCGLAYYCPTCRLLFVAEAPSEVTHCGGRIDKPDTGLFSRLPTYKLENFGVQYVAGDKISRVATTPGALLTRFFCAFTSGLVGPIHMKTVRDPRTTAALRPLSLQQPSTTNSAARRN